VRQRQRRSILNMNNLKMKQIDRPFAIMSLIAVCRGECIAVVDGSMVSLISIKPVVALASVAADSVQTAARP
jgi:hypothetical protein